MKRRNDLRGGWLRIRDAGGDDKNELAQELEQPRSSDVAVEPSPGADYVSGDLRRSRARSEGLGHLEQLMLCAAPNATRLRDSTHALTIRRPRADSARFNQSAASQTCEAKKQPDTDTLLDGS